jgi:hypothetical protein
VEEVLGKVPNTMGNRATIWAPRSPFGHSLVTFPNIKMFGLIGIAQKHLRMHLQIPEGSLVRFASVRLLRLRRNPLRIQEGVAVCRDLHMLGC